MMNEPRSVFTAALLALGISGPLAATEADSQVTSALDDVETGHLVFMREEEKLARDTYLTLEAIWGQRVFSNIARSEQTHMDTLLTLLTGYGITTHGTTPKPAARVSS